MFVHSVILGVDSPATLLRSAGGGRPIVNSEQSRTQSVPALPACTQQKRTCQYILAVLRHLAPRLFPRRPFDVRAWHISFSSLAVARSAWPKLVLRRPVRFHSTMMIQIAAFSCQCMHSKCAKRLLHRFFPFRPASRQTGTQQSRTCLCNRCPFRSVREKPPEIIIRQLPTHLGRAWLTGPSVRHSVFLSTWIGACSLAQQNLAQQNRLHSGTRVPMIYILRCAVKR